MEVQFQKTTCPYLRQVLKQTETQELTQEIRLTEGLPELGTVLGAWGQVLLRNKEWRNDSIAVGGGVALWVLYTPEGGGRAQWVEEWIPFRQQWQLPEAFPDGRMIVQCGLRFAEARSSSARKLTVRVGIYIEAQALVKGELVQWSVPELPEDIQLRKVQYPLQLPREVGEKTFRLEEALTLPGDMSPPEKLIHWAVHPIISEKKVIGDKLVFRGVCALQVFYRGTDGLYNGHCLSLPFSQFGELDREYGPDGTGEVSCVLTEAELELDGEGRLRLNAGLTGQYAISERILLETVEDAYSTCRPLEIKTQSQKLWVTLEQKCQKISATANSDPEAGRILDLSFWPELPKTDPQPKGVQIDLSGIFQGISVDRDGMLQGKQYGWKGTAARTVDGDVTLQARTVFCGLPQASVSEMRCEFALELSCSREQTFTTICALDVGEPELPDEDRPSLILRRSGSGGLWALAKECGSTIEEISAANGLTQEPEPDRFLIIPVQ